MKKKLILSIAAALFSASAFAGGPEMVIVAPNPFDGFYVGGYGSFHQTGFDIDDQTNFVSVFKGKTSTFTLSTLSGGDSHTDGYFGVKGGWGKVFQNRWYAGAEGWGEFGNSNGSITAVVSPNTPFAASFSDSGKVQDVWGGAARIGILLSPTTLAYGIFGAEWANIKVSTNGSANNGITTFGQSSDSEDKVGFVWGFGAEQMVWRDIVGVFGQYTYVNFGSVSTTFEHFFFGPDRNGNSFSLQHSNNVGAEVSAFSGGLNFHFGRWFL